MRNALYDIANFWADKGVGVFRVDAVTYIKKTADFKDGLVDELTEWVGKVGNYQGQWMDSCIFGEPRSA